EFPAAQLSRADLAKRLGVLKEVTALLQRLGHPADHGLAPVRRKTWSPPDQDAFAADLDAALRLCSALRPQLETLGTALGHTVVSAPLSDVLLLLRTVAQVQRGGAAERALLDLPDPTAAKAAALRYLDAAQARDDLRERLDEHYSDALLELDLDQLATQLRTW